MASGVIDIKRIGYDGLFDGKPSSNDTYQTVALATGKKFSDYTTLLFLGKFYGNVREAMVIPTGIFTTLTSEGQRLMMFSGDATAIAEIYYVSDTSMAIKVHNVATHSVAVYGMLV